MKITLPYRELTISVLLAFLWGASPSLVNCQTDTYPRVSSSVASGSQVSQKGRQTETNLPCNKYSLQLNLGEIVKILPVLDLKSSGSRKPNQIGVVRAIDIQSNAEGKLFSVLDGSKVRIFGITSPGA